MQVIKAHRNLKFLPAVKWSLSDKHGVFDWVDQVVLKNAKFKPATPEQHYKVANGPRDVCLWATGEWIQEPINVPIFDLQVLCDPKKSCWPIDALTGEYIERVKYLFLTNTGKALYIPIEEKSLFSP